MTTYNTLLLDRTVWDLVLDSAGNIAMASPPYAVAQDVASAVRLFLDELWYAPTKGIPYFDDVLGHFPPITLMTGYIEAAARSVPGVVRAQCFIQTFTTRQLTGELRFVDESGNANAIQF